ncbi:MAG: Gfo/Idh/MocA family oxidoreductase [Planctomycetota bacterium]
MELSPEDKEIGKQNFHEAVGTTRRDFLKGTVMAGVAGGATLGATYFKYGSISGEPLRVGIIGTGDEGGVLIGGLNPDYVNVVAIADIRPYNIHRAFHGDWSSDGTKYARPGLMDVYGWKTEEEARKTVKVYDNDQTDGYQELLDDPDVEAVIIALPLWLHDVAAVQAMRKGKHVLTEKLMAHSVAQCKEMGRVAKETDKILATGHQRHYSVLYDNAVDQIKRGLLGDIHHIRAQWHRGNLPGSDSWQPPMPKKYISPEEYVAMRRAARQPGAAQNEADLRAEYKLVEELHSWKRKLASTTGTEAEKWAKKVAHKEKQLEDYAVDAAKFGYESKPLPGVGRTRTPLEELIRWRLWDRTGGGLMAELGSHQLDASGIFISSQRDDGGKVLPLSVVGVGGRHIFPADRDVDDHVYCSFEYPGKGYYEDFESKKVADDNKKIVVTYSSINGNGYGGYGEIVMGTAGTLILEREKDVMLYKRSETSTKISVSEGSGGAVMNTYETGGGMAAVAAAATPAEVSRGYQEEIEHWAWCIRNPAPENQPKCTPKVAMADAVIALTSNIAMKENRRIEFEEAWFDIDSDETPEGRKPRPLSELG